MKNIIKIISAAFLIFSQFANAQEMSEVEYDEFAAFFATDALYMDSIMRNIPPPTFSQESFSVSTVYKTRANYSLATGIDKILIIASSAMYQELGNKINRYANDVRNTIVAE